MKKNWQDLHTIHDVLNFCQERSSMYRYDMIQKEKEHIASMILPFSFSDHFDEWAEDYPELYDIEILVSDLEWSNSSDIDRDWEKLRSLIARLERKINLK